MAERPPLWRRLFAIADAAVERLTDEWAAFFRAARTRVRRTDLTEELSAANILPATQAVRQIVEQTIERPARRTMPDFAMRIVEEAGQATTATLAPRPLVPLAPFPAPPYVTGLADTEQWVQQHIGVQIRNITETTMQTVRQTLQEGWREGLHPRVLARQLRGNIGLTPRQASAIEKQAAKWTEQGMPARAVQKGVRQLQERAIRQRAETIARTETLAYSNYGSHSAIQQYVRRGIVDEGVLVRQWLPTTDAKACPECLSIPGMNPHGVGLHEEFQTPFGPLLLPPAHPACRCAVITTTSRT